jgi:hypothetical protein
MPKIDRDIAHANDGIAGVGATDLVPAIKAATDQSQLPDAGNLPVRFDERDVETEPGLNHQLAKGSP